MVMSESPRRTRLYTTQHILPVRIDDTDLDGLPPTIGYVPIAMGIEQIADLLIKKLRT